MFTLLFKIYFVNVANVVVKYNICKLNTLFMLK